MNELICDIMGVYPVESKNIGYLVPCQVRLHSIALAAFGVGSISELLNGSALFTINESEPHQPQHPSVFFMEDAPKLKLKEQKTPHGILYKGSLTINMVNDSPNLREYLEEMEKNGYEYDYVLQCADHKFYLLRQLPHASAVNTDYSKTENDALSIIIDVCSCSPLLPIE